MNKDEQVSAMVKCFDELRTVDCGERIRDSVLRWIEDPLKPLTATGWLRINPILLLLACLAVMATGTFLVFSLVASLAAP
jgi:hypothetical protein